MISSLPANVHRVTLTCQASAFRHFGRTYRSAKISNISRSVFGKYSSPVERSANLPESNLRFLPTRKVSSCAATPYSSVTCISFSAYRLWEFKESAISVGSQRERLCNVLEISLKHHASRPAEHGQRILCFRGHDEIHSSCQTTLYDARPVVGRF